MIEQDWADIEYCPFCGEEFGEQDDIQEWDEKYPCPECGEVRIEAAYRFVEVEDEEDEPSGLRIVFPDHSEEEIRELGYDGEIDEGDDE